MPPSAKVTVFNFGFGKRKAPKATEITSTQIEELNNNTEVFENEKFHILSREWKPSAMTLCSDPTTKVAQLFDPKIIQVSTETSQWYIDFSLDGIDIEGWTYARNMTYLNKHIVGTAKDRWNCNVRRRKWKFRANQDSKDVISWYRFETNT